MFEPEKSHGKNKGLEEIQAMGTKEIRIHEQCEGDG